MSLPPDLIIYVIIAVVLVVWLRSILGTRTGEERQRPNPFEPSNNTPAENTTNFQNPEQDSAAPVRNLDLPLPVGVNANQQQPIPIKLPPHCSMEEGVLSGLRAMQNVDRGFDVNGFVVNAQDAYSMILESYGEGDTETLDDLLAASVYKTFADLIAQRNAKGGRAVIEIQAIRNCVLTEAVLKKTTANIALRFTSDALMQEYDADGKLVAGHETKTTEFVDEWVFSRDLAQRSPVWKVVEIRDAIGS
jgi:predicted lipid-binding transport protein (Tim44 family)